MRRVCSPEPGRYLRPEANMTYAEFLTVLSQFSGRPLPPVTGGAWYDTYVQWAQPLIPAGMAENFNPTAPITRQDMAACSVPSLAAMTTPVRR